ncbi:MAG TPA: ribosome maturation factor RimP [Elusimicrobiota bacterium]|nr:ribosome maturation factor RimP [Elusimicrobiota bacterium]
MVDEVRTLVSPVLAQEGVELVEVEYQREPNGWTLRFYLDKAGGFSLADCEQWNDRLGEVLDRSELISHAYSLEISSPGLNRPLRKREDFERFSGMDAFVNLYAQQNGQKHFHGRLVRVENGELVLEDRTSGFVKIPLSSIAGARLDPPVALGGNAEKDMS